MLPPEERSLPHRRRFLLAAALVALLASAPLRAQAPPEPPAVEVQDDLVQLDFNDVEIAVVIDTIAKLTRKNFIYDDRVRGRVTIVSPTRITVDQAYAVFESVLQVKGFTTVPGPGGAIKVIPIREAKETSIETVRGRTPESDRFITRLIPLRYIEAEAIANTLKPLVSKDAAIVAYTPTNTVILTDSASNIRRILDILSEIDVETYKEELAVLKLQHADAATLAQQISEIYGADVATAQVTPTRRARARTTPGVQPGQPGAPASKVRIVTDERTNSLIVLASRQDQEEIRSLVARLDVPVTGGGRIHVYYLKNADAEELAETLNAMISGQPSAPRSTRFSGAEPVSATPQALRAAVTELSEGITVTADPGTNSLVIQASQEGFATLKNVIEELDIPRPQVLVEALIMEVDVTDNQQLGFNGIARIVRGDTDYAIGSLTGIGNVDFGGADVGDIAGGLAGGNVVPSLVAAAAKNTLEDTDGDGIPDKGSLIQGIITASAKDNDAEILSAPHILTSDNEEAEIKVGANIPIITSRVQSAGGIDIEPGDQTSQLATSVNVERQDIGVTLRVTPQISEGDNVRLEIFQEITDFTSALVQAAVGTAENVGVALTSRKVENTVVVQDGETVVIGGLISDDYEDTVTKIPWLGDIPFLGWLFKSTSRNLTKTNLLVFLTPHIVRESGDLAGQTIRKREEFRAHSIDIGQLSGAEREREEERREQAQSVGITPPSEREPVRASLQDHERRYPLERMREIEADRRERDARAAEEAARAASGPSYAVLAAVFRDERAATETLTKLLDAGYEGTLVSGQSEGTVLFEVRLGPFGSLEEAEEAAGVARQAFGLAPSVLVERPEP